STPQRLLRARVLAHAAVLPSGLPDTVGASVFGYFGAHHFGIPSLHVPLSRLRCAPLRWLCLVLCSNASSAPLQYALAWLGVRFFRTSFPLCLFHPLLHPVLSRPYPGKNACPTWLCHQPLCTRSCDVLVGQAFSPAQNILNYKCSNSRGGLPEPPHAL